MSSVTSRRQRKILGRKDMFKRNSPNSLILKDDQIIRNFLAQLYFIKTLWGLLQIIYMILFFLCDKNEFLKAEN